MCPTQGVVSRSVNPEPVPTPVVSRSVNSVPVATTRPRGRALTTGQGGSEGVMATLAMALATSELKMSRGCVRLRALFHGQLTLSPCQRPLFHGQLTLCPWQRVRPWLQGVMATLAMASATSVPESRLNPTQGVVSRSVNPEPVPTPVVSRSVNSVPVATGSEGVMATLAMASATSVPESRLNPTQGVVSRSVNPEPVPTPVVSRSVNSVPVATVVSRSVNPEPVAAPVVSRSANPDSVATTGIPRALATGHTAQGSLISIWVKGGRGLRGHRPGRNGGSSYGFARCSTVR